MAVAAAAPSSYKPEYKAPEITIVSQSDVRNLDGSGQWRYINKPYSASSFDFKISFAFFNFSYAGSDGTTRDEAYAQKTFKGVTYDSYGKESYGEVQGHTKQQGIFLLGFT